VRALHFPESWEALERARTRLAYDELLAMQILLALRRREAVSIHKPRGGADGDLVRRFHGVLPFAPTGAQSRVFGEIDADLLLERPMNRLVQGDVGSGKTLVAAHALVRTVAAGMNGALLAPTETLAEQHAANLGKLLSPLDIAVKL